MHKWDTTLDYIDAFADDLIAALFSIRDAAYNGGLKDGKELGGWGEVYYQNQGVALNEIRDAARLVCYNIRALLRTRNVDPFEDDDAEG